MADEDAAMPQTPDERDVMDIDNEEVPSSGAPSALWKAEEIQCMREVKRMLIEVEKVPADDVTFIELAVSCLNCKLRPEKAVGKFLKWRESLRAFNINSFAEAWGEVRTDDDWSIVGPMFEAYEVCGKDREGRSVFWIRGNENGIPVEKERDAVRAGMLYFLSIHADLVSLRNGISFIIDSTNSSTVGNERKLQRTWQSFPLRPQAIFILGAGRVKRIFINALIRFASLFTKDKVIDRIRFANVADVETVVEKSSQPPYVGGSGPGADGRLEWVQQRLKNFPAPPEGL